MERRTEIQICTLCIFQWHVNPFISVIQVADSTIFAKTVIIYLASNLFLATKTQHQIGSATLSNARDHDKGYYYMPRLEFFVYILMSVCFIFMLTC